MKYPSYIQQQTKLFSPYDGVDFHSSRATLPIDPYFLGVWLGDGTKHIRGKNSVVAITKDDIEIKECCEREAERWGLHTKTYYRYENNRDGSTRIVGDKGKKNPLLSTLRAIPELPDGIPLQYLTASREDRKALLAGLIDTDGHVSGGCADIIQKRKGLADGIAFLSRSLGFHVYESLKYVKGYTDPYFRCSISGNLSSLPMRIARKQAQPRKSKKNHNRRGFTVEPLGVGAYYGFTLDGEDGRFLLGDLTVTHNTTFSKKLHLLFYGRGVKLFGVKNNQSDWTTTVSNYPLALFDNVDAPTPWWLPAALAVSITPMDATKRSLYSNNTPYTARMDAMVGLSSHDGSFLKEDIIDRGILIQCRRIEEDERLEEQPMLDAILRDREELLGGLMADVIHVLRTPRPEAAKGSAIRIVDFNAIGGWIARGIGKEQEFHSAIGTLSIHQKAKVLEEDITLVMALEDMQRVSPLATEWATHTQIWTELISLADDNGEALRSQYKNGHLFGRKLLAIATQLRDSIGLQMQDDPARGWKVFKVSGYNSGKKKGSRSAE